jgi:integrase
MNFSLGIKVEKFFNTFQDIYTFHCESNPGHASGGELEQIQFLLGHVSVQTTERYLGCKQRIQSAVNDRIGIEPQL